MVVEARRELRELRLDRIEARAFVRFEADTGVARVAQETVDDAALGRIEGIEGRAAAQSEQAVVERRALGLPQAEGDHLALHRRVGLAQGVAVADREHVAHETPGVGEPLVQPFEGEDESVPARLDPGLEPVELRGELGEQLSDAGHDLPGLEEIEAGQLPAAPERIDLHRRLDLDPR